MNLVLVTNQLVLFRLNPFVSSSLLKGCKQRAEGFGEIWASRGFATTAFFFPPSCPSLPETCPTPYLSYGSVAALYSRCVHLPTLAPFVLFFLCQKLPLLLSLFYAKSCFFLFSCIQTKGNNQCFSYSKDCLSFFLVKHALKHCFSLFVIGQTLGWSRIDCVMTSKIEGKG